MADFGWSLPPGVTSDMIDRAYGWDPDPYVPLKCARCGGFLKAKPERTEAWEDGITCDGTVQTYETEYDDLAVAILGDEYRGRRYSYTVSPCGIEQGVHAPHFDLMAAGTHEYRTCTRCGYENREVIL